MAEKRYFRTPKGYRGTRPTTRQLGEVLPWVMRKVAGAYADNGDYVLSVWPEVVGEMIAKMTQAIAFKDGILTVKVKNSTLHSLLSRRDKPLIIKKMRERLPATTIKTIVFRIG